MVKRFATVFLIVLLVAGALTFAPAGVASASSVHSRAVTHPVGQLRPDLCQSSSLVIYLLAGGQIDLNCSGTYNPEENVRAFAANNWSGYAYVNFGTGEFWLGYCNGNYIYNNTGLENYMTLYSIYLSPTKESWCS